VRRYDETIWVGKGKEYTLLTSMILREESRWGDIFIGQTLKAGQKGVIKKKKVPFL